MGLGLRHWAVLALLCGSVLLGCGDDDGPSSVDAGHDARIDDGGMDATEPPPDGAVDDDASGPDANGSDASVPNDPTDHWYRHDDSPCTPQLSAPGENLNLLRFDSPELRIHVVRRWDDFGTGESSIYSLQRAVVEYRGQCWTVTDAGRLTYTNSHHNWRDSLTIETDARTWTVALSFRVDGTSGWDVTASAPDVDAGEPIALVVSGATNPGFFDVGFLPVHINELMTSDASDLRDDANEATAWVELFNPSSSPVDLSGYHLQRVDAPSQPYVFAQGTLLGRHEYMVLFADGETGEGARHLPFTWPVSGAVRLIAPDGNSAGERHFEGASATQSYIHVNHQLEPETIVTPGAENPRF